MQLELWRQSLAAALHGAPASWPAAALAVHRSNWLGAREQALATAYPALKRVLGERCFATLARDFPAAESDLNLLGRGFPQWLRVVRCGRPELAALPYLVDLARLEWAVHAAYFAADDPAPDGGPYRRAQRAPRAYRFRVSASLSLLASRWPIAAIRRLNCAPGPAKSVAAGACHLVVWRQRVEPIVAELPAAAWRLLRAAQRGASVAEMLDSGMRPDAIGGFVAQGWITGTMRARRP